MVSAKTNPAKLLIYGLLFMSTLQTTAFAQRFRKETQSTFRGELLRIAMNIQRTRLDCSHLVNELYSRAGLRYPYATSRQLYQGVPNFERVSHPKAGDLIVWLGHVGVVVDPEQRTFLSAQRMGVKVTPYDSKYWKSRGAPRFFRHTLIDRKKRRSAAACAEQYGKAFCLDPNS